MNMVLVKIEFRCYSTLLIKCREKIFPHIMTEYTSDIENHSFNHLAPPFPFFLPANDRVHRRAALFARPVGRVSRVTVRKSQIASANELEAMNTNVASALGAGLFELTCWSTIGPHMK
ncbi:MAG: hypothetical protein M3461_19545 [Pseudomonadota bacterium]|nr:hypothetical protein [Pseudomonadota bacterium]